MEPPRCLTIILACGWLLLTPPARPSPDGSVTIESNTPIRSWDQEYAYDTAKECQRGKDLRASLRPEPPQRPKNRRLTRLYHKSQNPLLVPKPLTDLRLPPVSRPTV